MDVRPENDDETRTEQQELYEPPMLDEIGGFTALTRANSKGEVVERTGYYSE